MLQAIDFILFSSALFVIILSQGRIGAASQPLA
jgi:hypothetical protein